MVRLRLLDTPRAEHQTRRWELPPHKPVYLLLYLALQPGWVSREGLADLFAPDADEATARHTVRVLLNRAKALPWVEGLEAEPSRIRWQVSSDVLAFRQAVQQGNWAEAVRLHQSPLLLGFPIRDAAGFEAWLELERSELQNAWREAALHYAISLGQTERPAEAAALLRSIWEKDHFDERILQAYMGQAYVGGNRDGALSTYGRFKQSLHDDLGLDPLPQTVALAWAIENHQPLQQEGKATQQATWNLNPLVGRQSELAELKQALGQPTCQVLVLTGLGGVGKTRLALELAQHSAAQFSHGVYLVPLASLTTPEQIIPAIAQAVGFGFFGPREPKEQLVDYLRKKQMLLVVDNLEHLLGGAPLLLELIEGAPGLKLLITSRHKPELPGVWSHPIEGLPYLQEGGAVSDAMLLFIQAAKRQQPRFQPGHHDLLAIAQLGRLVEGLPLALELAAAWVGDLSPAEILSEVQGNSGSLGAMQAVLEHSWSLLSLEQQDALTRLSVFRGGFNRQAAQAVASASPYLLLSLQSRSLIQRGPKGRFGIHGLVRQFAEQKLALSANAQPGDAHASHFAAFAQAHQPHLQGPQQAQALDGLSEELDNLRWAWNWALLQRNWGWLDGLLGSLVHLYRVRGLFQEGLRAIEQAAEAFPLEVRLSILRAMFLRHLGQSKQALVLLESLARTSEPATQALFHTALGSVHDDLGNYPQAQSHLEQSLELYRQQNDPYLQAQALDFLGGVAYHRGEHRTAQQHYRSSLEISQQLGDLWGQAQSLGNLATVADHLGQYQESQQLHLQSLHIKEALGNQHGLAVSLMGLGTLAYQQGNYEEARRRFRSALDIFGKLGDRAKAAAALNNLGGIGFALGNFEETRQALLELIPLRQELGDRSGEARSLNNLALATKQLGQAAEARPLFEQSLNLRREMGDQQGVCQTLAGLGFVNLDLAAYDQARSSFEESIRVANEIGALPSVLDALEGLGKVLARQGESARAMLYAALVLEHPSTIEYSKTRARQLLSELQMQLSSVEMQAISDQAKTISLEQLIGEILAATRV
jgi:predicted ATPase